MTEITTSSVHSVGGKEVVVRELSVAEVRKLMSKDVSVDPLGDGLFGSIRLSDIPDFTSLSLEDLEQLRPSQIRQVVTLCEGQNPDFFAWLGKVSTYQAKP